ncbi:MAG: adenylate/guanylate cyclase domain-containing protein [Thermoproteota archaeon]|nr:adenylate/guanylate cyclase domain-containing protein [Thermoproteota archaeon]
MNIDNSYKTAYQRQTIINLYECGISPDVIAYQLDADPTDIINTLKNTQSDNKRKEKSISDASSIPKMGMIYLDSVFDVESAIKDTQKRTWSELKVEPNFYIPLDNTQTLLEKFIDTRIDLVILHVDLVSSTRLSMNLPLRRLVPIVQAFTQEMSLIVEAYGGYVFKYVGDAVLAFFFTEKDNLHMPCSNAVSCGLSMVRIIEEGMNTILNENGYPELQIRVGIDVGESAVIRYGLKTNDYTKTEKENGKENNHVQDANKHDNINVIREPYLDILGYSINTASKMTGFARPNQIVIGEAVYNRLDDNTKQNFESIDIDSKSWSFIDNSTGNVYRVYGN